MAILLVDSTKLKNNVITKKEVIVLFSCWVQHHPKNVHQCTNSSKLDFSLDNY